MDKKLVVELAVFSLVAAGEEHLRENRDLRGLGIGIRHLKDACWAVLGELPDSETLTLTLSRVREMVGRLVDPDREGSEEVRNALLAD